MDELLETLRKAGKELKEKFNITSKDIDRAIKEIRGEIDLTPEEKRRRVQQKLQVMLWIIEDLQKNFLCDNAGNNYWIDHHVENARMSIRRALKESKK